MKQAVSRQRKRANRYGCYTLSQRNSEDELLCYPVGQCKTLTAGQVAKCRMRDADKGKIEAYINIFKIQNMRNFCGEILSRWFTPRISSPKEAITISTTHYLNCLKPEKSSETTWKVASQSQGALYFF